MITQYIMNYIHVDFAVAVHVCVFQAMQLECVDQMVPGIHLMSQTVRVECLLTLWKGRVLKSLYFHICSYAHNYGFMCTCANTALYNYELCT